MASEQQTVEQRAQRDAALRLNMVAGVGPRIYSQLIERFGSPADVLAADPSSLNSVPGVGKKLANEISRAQSQIDVEPQLEICRQNKIQVLDRTSEHYPNSLAEIHDPPNVLFVKGRLDPCDEMAIAIVGTRHASSYGIKTAELLARGLASAGFTIVSGLARGIDSAAHRGALQAGGRTLAILGSGVLNVYPPENAEMAAEIQNQGAIMSQALPLAPPKSGAFPQRNRIITGLSLGVVIVEASQRSGALISARLASEQGREVFAVPGRIDSRASRGCHRLIRDGAKLIESIDDVIEELGPLALPAQVGAEKVVHHPAELKLTEQETTVLQTIGTDPTEFDSIVQQSGLPAARVLSTISVLEIRHLVRRVSGTALIRL